MKPVVAALALLSSAAIAEPAVAAQLAVVPTDKVEVSGVSTRYRAVGLAGRTPGSAVVIFQNGAGSPLEVWASVMDGLGETPMLAYDRPGIAGSSFDGRPTTPGRVNEHLRALLTALNIAPPYILVGHSWGGALILDYAGSFPGEVAGMVYVDPSILVPKPADTRRILGELGATDEEIATYERNEAAAIEAAVEALRQAPPGARAEVNAMDAYRRAQAAAPVESLSDLPTSVILAGRTEPAFSPPPGMLPPSIAWPRLFDANLALRQARFRERLANVAGASVMVSKDATHAVHRDTPAIIVREIRRVVEATTRR